jgi:hypothetical protein
MVMPGREELLQRLADTPRENGTPALDETASFLAETLRGLGLQVELSSFVAHPYGIRLLGLFVLIAGLTYFWALRTGRWRAALGLAVLLPLVVVLQNGLGLPLLGVFGAQTEQNITALVPAVTPEQRLVFSAHYDTKTDLFDHVVRTPIYLLGLPAAVLLLLGPLAVGAGNRKKLPRSRKLTRRLALGAAGLYCPLLCLAASGGALVGQRSRGALDDGGACIALLELAHALAEQPPERTEVEIVFFAAEELGAEGSQAHVPRRFAGSDDMPTRAVNLELIGASTSLAILSRETSLLHGYDADPTVVELLRSVHHERVGGVLPLTPVGGTTDGLAFRKDAIPAATLVATVPPWWVPRGMHSSADERSRIDMTALDRTRDLLLAIVREVDGPAGG